MEQIVEYAEKAARWWKEQMLCYYLERKLDKFEESLIKRIADGLQISDSVTLETEEHSVSAILFWAASDAQISMDAFPQNCRMKISLKNGVVVDGFQIWPPI